MQECKLQNSEKFKGKIKNCKCQKLDKITVLLELFYFIKKLCSVTHQVFLIYRSF